MISKKKIHIPIYGAELTVYLVDSYQELTYKKILPEYFSDMGGAMVIKPRDNELLIYKMIFERTTFPIGVVAHECLHLIRHLYQDIGITFNMENDEHQCYLMGFLFDKVYQFICDNMNSSRAKDIK